MAVIQTVDVLNPFPNLFCYLGVHFRTYYGPVPWGASVYYGKRYEGNAEEHGNHKDQPFKEILQHGRYTSSVLWVHTH